MSEPETGEARMQRLSIMVPVGYVTPERRPGGWARYVPIVTARDAIRQAEAELRASLAAKVERDVLPLIVGTETEVRAGLAVLKAVRHALIEGSDPASPERECVSCWDQSHDADTHDHHLHGDRFDPRIGPAHEGSDPASPEAATERVGRMQTALGGAGVLADGLNSWSAARAVIDHLDALAYAGQPFASVPRLGEPSRG